MRAGDRLRRWAPMLVSGALGLTLSGAVAWQLHQSDTRQVLFDLDREVSERVERLERAIVADLEVVLSVKGLFDASTHLSRSDFNRFAMQALERHPEIQALEWIPRVRRGERERYEREAREDGLDDFRITERLQQGTMVPAVERSEYYPVYYVEPLLPNRAALGFDLASDPVRKVTLEQARDSGRLQATAAVTLVQETGTQRGFLVFAPVYAGGEAESVGQPEPLRGFALGVFRIGEIVEKEMLRADARGLGYATRLRDDSAPLENSLLYSSGFGDADPELADVVLSHPLREIGGRRWRVEAVPTAAHLDARRSGRAPIVLAFGLLITLVLVSYLRAIARRSAEIERLVGERTQALQDSELHVKTIVEMALTGIVTIDERGTIESVNPAVERIFGYPAALLVGRNVKQLATEPHRSRHDDYLRHYLETGERRIIGAGREVGARRSDGSTLPVDLAVSEMHVGGRRKFIGMITDISELKRSQAELEEANRELERLSLQDFLTGLYNRRHFSEVLEREWRRAARSRSPLSLLLLDVDYFKRYNDRYGHQAGDDCLRRIAEVLGGVARRPGDLVARHGGEEFTVLLPATDEVGARVVAELCRDGVSALQIPHEDSDADPCVTISIGLCCVWPEHEREPEAIVEWADRALYDAKQSGRNCVVPYRPAGAGEVA